MTGDDVIITDHTKEKTSGFLLDVKPSNGHFNSSRPKKPNQTVENDEQPQQQASDTESEDSFIQDPDKYSLKKLEFKDKLSRQICSDNSETLEGVSISNRRLLVMPIPSPRTTYDLSFEPIGPDYEDSEISMTPKYLRTSVNLLVSIGKSLIASQYSDYYHKETLFAPLSGINDNPEKGLIEFPKPSSSSIRRTEDTIYTRHLNWKLKTISPNTSMETVRSLNACANNKCVYHFTSSLLLSSHVQTCHLRATRLYNYFKSTRFFKKIYIMPKNHAMLPLPYNSKNCTLCEKSYHTRIKLLSHFERDHGLQFLGEDITKPDVCDYCRNYKPKNSTSIPCIARKASLTPTDIIYEAGLAADPARNLDGHSIALLILIPNPGASFYFSSREIQHHVDKFVFNYLKNIFDNESFTIAQRYSIAVSSLYGILESKYKLSNRVPEYHKISWQIDKPKPLPAVDKEYEIKTVQVVNKRPIESVIPKIEDEEDLTAKRQRLEDFKAQQEKTIQSLLNFEEISVKKDTCEFCTSKEHGIIKLSENEELSCPICHQITDCISRLAIHLSVIHNAYYSIDNLRSNIVKTDPEIDQHIPDKINDIICEFCFFVTDDDTVYMDHILNTHKEENEVTILVCRDCFMTCRTRNGYKNHTNTKCFICETEIPCFTKLISHIYLYHGRVIPTPEVRKRLKSCVSNQSQCKICGLKFLRPELLKRHLEMVHNKMKCCSRCKSLFPDEKSCTAHQNVTCPVCNIFHSCLTEIRKHMEKKHAITFSMEELKALAQSKVPDECINPKSDPKVISNYYRRLVTVRSARRNGLFHCFPCRKGLKGWKNFDEHVIRLHSKVGKKVTLPCSICKIPLDDTIDLFIHLKSKHNLSTLVKILDENESANSQPRQQENTDMIALRAIGNPKRYTNNNRDDNNANRPQQFFNLNSRTNLLNLTIPTTTSVPPSSMPVNSPISVVTNRITRPVNPNNIQQYIIANSNFQMPRFIVSKPPVTSSVTTQPLIPQIIPNQSNTISSRPQLSNPPNLDQPKLLTQTNQTTSIANSSNNNSQVNIVPLTITSLNSKTQIIRPLNLAPLNSHSQNSSQPSYVLQIPQQHLTTPLLTQPKSSTIPYMASIPNLNKNVNSLPKSLGQDQDSSEASTIPSQVIKGPIPSVATSTEAENFVDNLTITNVTDNTTLPEVDKSSSKQFAIFCQECNLRFFHVETMNEHKKWMHELPEKYLTKDLTKPFISNEEFPYIPTTTIYYCTDCRMELQSQEKMMIHKKFRCKFRSFITQQVCEICNVVVSSKMTLMHHMIKKHAREIGESCQPAKTWRCDQCVSDFFLEKTLEDHEFTICPYCFHWFPCFTFLYNHVFLMHSSSVDKMNLFRMVNNVYEYDMCIYRCLNCDINIGCMALLASHLFRDHFFDKIDQKENLKRGIRCSKCDHFISNVREYIFHNFHVHQDRADVTRRYRPARLTDVSITNLNNHNVIENKENRLSPLMTSNSPASIPSSSTSSHDKVNPDNQNASSLSHKSKRKSQPKKIITESIPVVTTTLPTENDVTEKNQADAIACQDSQEPSKKRQHVEETVHTANDNLGEDSSDKISNGHVTCPICEFSSISRDEIMDHLASQHC